MEAKFKVGDKVRGRSNYHQEWVEGVEFVVTGLNRGSANRANTFYYEGDPNDYGVWEENLELVESAGPTLEDRVASLEKRLDEVEKLPEKWAADLTTKEPRPARKSLSDLPYGSLIDTGAFIYVKTSENQWLAVLVSDTRENISGKLQALGPFMDGEFPDSTKVIREGV